MKKIVFCGGGSFGHIMPNIAIIEELKSSFDIYYIGTNGAEKSICENFGIKFYECDAVKFVRGKFFCNLKIPFSLLKSIGSAKSILNEIKPNLVFLKGGYVCLPTAFAASKLKIKMITHESDISLGLANKIISKKCVKVLTSFPSLAKELKNGIYVGSPIRKTIFYGDKRTAEIKFNLSGKKTILVLGGGSGSRAINDCIRSILPSLCKNFNVLHICGKGNLIECNIDGYRQIETCFEMADAYACADFAISRCGSGAAHELLALKIPTLFIPLENSQSRGDQIKNAEYFLSLGACRVLRQPKMNEQTLKNEINALVEDKFLVENLKKSNIKCGTSTICKEIINTIYSN